MSRAHLRCSKAACGYAGEGLDDGAVFAGAVGEFDVAADLGSPQGAADDVGSDDLGDACRCDGDSEACTYEAENRQPLRSFLDDAGAEAVLLAERDGLLEGAIACRGGEEDEGLVAEAGGGDGVAGCERMMGGEDGHEGFGEERLDVQLGGGAAVAQEASVEGALDEPLHHHGGVGLVELELYVGELPAITAEHGGQCCEHAGADEADAKGADLAAADAACLFEVLLYVAEGAAGALEEDEACAGELDGARGADEESVAEDLLELANLLGEGRLGEVQALGCAAEVQLLGDGDEVAQVA